jgi:hypothetical protein
MVVNLQAALSVFWDRPLFYNLTSYIVCGAMILWCLIKTAQTRFSPQRAWLALAAIAPLSVLVAYHRPYDARIILLTLPACAMLWARDKTLRRPAAIITAAGVLFTADIPLASGVVISKSLLPHTSGLLNHVLTVLLIRPASLALLIVAVFYLWVYLRVEPEQGLSVQKAAP